MLVKFLTLMVGLTGTLRWSHRQGEGADDPRTATWFGSYCGDAHSMALWEWQDARSCGRLESTLQGLATEGGLQLLLHCSWN